MYDRMGCLVLLLLAVYIYVPDPYIYMAYISSLTFLLALPQYSSHRAGYRLAADAARAYDLELERLNLMRDPNFRSEEHYLRARREEERRTMVAKTVAAGGEEGRDNASDDEAEDERRGTSSPVVGGEVGADIEAEGDGAMPVVSPSPVKPRDENERDALMAASIARQLGGAGSLV